MNLTQLLNSIRHDSGQAWLTLTDDWMQGRTAYGGLQGALAMEAMRQQVDSTFALRSFQATFVGPVPVGEVEARAIILRQGKSAVQVQASITVDDQVCFTAVGIFGKAREVLIQQEPTAPPCDVSRDQISSLPYLPGITPQFTQHVEMRWAKGKPPFSGTEDSVATIFVRHRDDDNLSDAHLIAMGDIIPPPIISMYRQPVLISSMNWQLEVVRGPEELAGNVWFRFDTEMTASHNGYCWQTAHIWSEQGDLVALSRQCVAVFK